MRYLLLLWLVFVCAAYVDCKGGGRGGRGGGRGGIFKSIFKGTGKKSSNTHSYPPSNGYSGHGSGGSHGYPPSNGLSGTGQKPTYGKTYGSSRMNYVPRVPSYYTSPQYVYVKQYQNSGSRYNTLLLGLIMYNMGRSHSVNHHYYQDSYYRASTSTTPSSIIDHLSTSLPTTTEDTADKNKNKATCLMRITENVKEDVLKIPCAIVTTFAGGKRKTPDAIGNTTTTVCVNSSTEDSTLIDSTENDHYISKYETLDLDLQENKLLCKSTIKAVDPLTVTGSPLNTTDMECAIEIWTAQEVISNEVDCNTLLRYANMPVPQNKDAVIMPPRSELKQMLQHPPWWLSLFVAV